MSTERCCAEEWSSRACKLFKEYTSQANALLFMESETHTDTKLGDLIAITSKTSNINLSQKLTQENVAIAVQAKDKFLQHLARVISRSAERWNDDKTSLKYIEETADVPMLGTFSGLRKSIVQNDERCKEMNYNMKVLDWKEKNKRTLNDFDKESIFSERISIPVQASDNVNTQVENLNQSMKNNSIERKIKFDNIVFKIKDIRAPENPVFFPAGSDLQQYYMNTCSTINQPATIAKLSVKDVSKIHDEWIPKVIQ